MSSFRTMFNSGLVVCLLCIYSVLPSAFSSHFLGGSIMVRPQPGGTRSEIQISYHISWKPRKPIDEFYCDSDKVANYEVKDGEDSIDCLYGCQNTVRITGMPYTCAGYSREHNWSYGEHNLTYNFSVSDVNQITIGTTGCCWVVSGETNWNISTTFSLVPRNDTGQINSSPRVMGFPYLQIPAGSYNYTISLAVTDPDDDQIRCRWAVGTECLSICNNSSRLFLDPDTCTITFPGNSYDRLSAVGVAVVVEDFRSGSSQPLSSVSHQFVVYVAIASRFCSLPPQFIAPTLPNGACITISPGTSFTLQMGATSRCSGVVIRTIQIIGPSGTIKGPLQQVSHNYYMNVTWIPRADQQNETHFICYVVINGFGYTSEQSCIKLIVGYRQPLTPLLETATPNHQLVYPSNNTLQIMFDRKIQRPSTSAFIRFYQSVGGLEVYQIDTSSSSSEVTYLQSNLTIVPNFTFTEGSSYYINFDEGVAQTDKGCQSTNSKPILNSTFWTFEAALTSVFTSNVSVTALSNQTVGQPLILQCSVTTIRGINSRYRVDFVWISNGRELERIEGVTGQSSINNLAVYTDYYTIPQLSIADNNSSYTCEVIINRSPLTSLSATGNITLDITVFNSTVSVMAHSNQTVGQPLILQCSVTIIRDINSRVDFVWISNGRELERVEGVTGESSIDNNLAVYTDYYIIPQLSIADNNSSYTCEVIINTSPLTSLSVTGNITLDITVFTSSVSVTTLISQTMGQPLILQCSVTTIRDINSRVDFVWISNGRELERVEGVTGESSTNNLAVYTEYYIIPQLSIADNNSLCTCEVIINTSPLTSLSATGNFTLDITDDDHDSNTPQPCTLPPRFVNPTSPQRECVVIPPGTHFVQQIMATSGCSNVTSIQVSAPDGTSVGELQHVQGTNNYYINVTWMPTADQQNKTHVLCSVAVNVAGLSSELFCMELAAGYLPPTPSPYHQVVYPSNSTLHVIFDRTIQRPSTSAFIRFYKLGEEVYQIDALSSSEVMFTEASLTIVPNYNFNEGSTYYINFDQGVVQTVYPEGCLLVNEPILSNTFWTLEVVSFESETEEMDNVCNDDDGGFGFMIMFAASAVVNLLLVAAVTILICLLMQRKKNKDKQTDKRIDPNHKAKHELNITASETIYGLPDLTSKVEQGKDSVTNYGYALLSQQEAKSQKQDRKSDDNRTKMEENPAYQCAVSHTNL